MNFYLNIPKARGYIMKREVCNRLKSLLDDCTESVPRSHVGPGKSTTLWVDDSTSYFDANVGPVWTWVQIVPGAVVSIPHVKCRSHHFGTATTAYEGLSVADR